MSPTISFRKLRVGQLEIDYLAGGCGLGMALGSREMEPNISFDPSFVPPGWARPQTGRLMKVAQIELRLCIALFGRASEPLECVLVASKQATSHRVRQTDAVLCHRIASFRRSLQAFDLEWGALDRIDTARAWFMVYRRRERLLCMRLGRSRAKPPQYSDASACFHASVAFLIPAWSFGRGLFGAASSQSKRNEPCSVGVCAEGFGKRP